MSYKVFIRFSSVLLAAALLALSLSGCEKPLKAEPAVPSPAPSPSASQPQPSVSPEETPSAAPETPSPSSPAPSPDHPVELDRDGLKKLEAELNESYAPFFYCTYTHPLEVDWNEVLYGGGRLGSKLTESELLVLEDMMGRKAVGSTVKVSRNEVERYVEQTTGTDYYDAWVPLRWYYMMDGDMFCCEYTPREGRAVELISASTDGLTYSVTYNGVNCAGETEPFNAVFEKSEDGFRFCSNRPAVSGGEFSGAYGSILRSYVTAMTDESMFDELSTRGGVSPLVSLFKKHAEPLDMVGACLMDLDGDAVDELIIGPADDEFFSEYIFQVYAFVRGRPLCIYSSPLLSAARLDSDMHIVENVQENLFSASKKLLEYDSVPGQCVVLDELTMSWDRRDYTCFRYTPEGGMVSISMEEFEAASLGAEMIKPEYVSLSLLMQQDRLY